MNSTTKKVTFSSNGVELAGSLEIPEGNPMGSALFAHCFTCSKDTLAASRISKTLVEYGFSVLRFDFTGLGSSHGDFSNTNFSSNVVDLVAAADFLRMNYQAPNLLIGHSLGGRAVLSAAHYIPECAGIATIGAPADAAHVAKQFGSQLDKIERDGKAEVELGGRKFTIEQQFLKDIRNDNNDIENLRVPLLIMHSPVDKTVSINQAEDIYRRAKHPKSFISLDKADHLLTNKSDANYVASVIASWSEKYIRNDKSIKRVTVEKLDVDKGTVFVGETNQRFTRAIATDDHGWYADEPLELGGDNIGADPYEHLLAALGACTSMTIRMYANRKSIPLEDIDVTLRHSRQHGEDCAECDKDNPRIDVIDREIVLKGNLTDDQKDRLLEIADKCPVHRTLMGKISIKTRLA